MVFTQLNSISNPSISQHFNSKIQTTSSHTTCPFPAPGLAKSPKLWAFLITKTWNRSMKYPQKRWIRWVKHWDMISPTPFPGPGSEEASSRACYLCPCPRLRVFPGVGRRWPWRRRCWRRPQWGSRGRGAVDLFKYLCIYIRIEIVYTTYVM